MFDDLVRERRAATVHGPAGELWCAVERRPVIEVLFPDAALVPDHPCPVAAPDEPPDEDAAAADLLRGHLDCRGPSTVADLAQATGLPQNLVIRALVRLEEEGFAIRGRFTAPGGPAESSPVEFCARRLLARIHAYTRQRQRAEIEPVTARDFMRFLLRWQHVEPGHQARGPVRRARGHRAAAGLRAGRRAPGRTRCWPPGWRATAANGWTSCACPARSPGDGCRCATPRPTRSPGAAG